MKFEVAINMDGKGFKSARRMSLVRVIEGVAKDVRSSDAANGVVTDWYGDPVGTWAITQNEST